MHLICASSLFYEDRLKKLGWSTLDVQRKYLCLVTLYKIIFEYNLYSICRYPIQTGSISIFDIFSMSQQPSAITFKTAHCATTTVQLTKQELSLETRLEKINMAADISNVNFHFLKRHTSNENNA